MANVINVVQAPRISRRPFWYTLTVFALIALLILTIGPLFLPSIVIILSIAFTLGLALLFVLSYWAIDFVCRKIFDCRQFRRQKKGG